MMWNLQSYPKTVLNEKNVTFSVGSKHTLTPPTLSRPHRPVSTPPFVVSCLQTVSRSFWKESVSWTTNDIRSRSVKPRPWPRPCGLEANSEKWFMITSRKRWNDTQTFQIWATYIVHVAFIPTLRSVSVYNLISHLRIYAAVFISGIRCSTVALSLRPWPWSCDPWPC